MARNGGWFARVALALLSALWLAGCASPYRPNTIIGGYQDEKLGENRWRVSYQGNGYTNEDTVVKYWLHRCAELTVKNGYTYFGLVQGSNRSGMDSRDTAYDLTPAETARLLGQDNGMRQVRSAPTYIWVPSYGGGVTTYSKTGVILMFHLRLEGGSQEQAYSLHAQTVLEMLKQFVQTQGKEAGPSRREVIDAALRLAPVPAGSR